MTEIVFVSYFYYFIVLCVVTPAEIEMVAAKICFDNRMSVHFDHL